MRRFPSRSAVALLVGVLGAPRLAAQAPVSAGFALERQGRHAAAADLYLEVLRADPSDAGALLGLERVLPRLNRQAELLPLVRRARALAPDNGVVRGIEVRALVSAEQLDAAAAAARAWAAAEPQALEPWREWGIALQDAGRFAAAREVLREGRRQLGQATALAAELAELDQRLGDWGAAAREWAPLVGGDPGQIANILYHLGEAPVEQRDAVLAGLGTASTPAVRRLAAQLLVAWGRPLDGWQVLAAALTGPRPEVVEALREFADRAAASPIPDARRARALALAALADLAPAPVAARARAEAARALIDAGDRDAARPLLERLAADPGATTAARALAEGVLLELLIDDGRLDEAARRLAAAGERIGTEEVLELRRRIARAEAVRGDLTTADTLLAGDSSVAALAIRGWTALYRGDLVAADSLFRRAGPYAGDRRDATDRTAMLALLQGITPARAPALGAALRLLARGDSARAATTLAAAAEALPPASRPGLQVLAGRVAARPGGDAALAERLFAAAARADSAGAWAPEAELDWARLLLAQRGGGGRVREAIALLEHLILTYPTSAFAPEARRELERARGAIPRS